MKVVDASIVNKLFLSNEEGSEKAEQIFSLHIQKKEELVVPELLFYEVANTLATKTHIPLNAVADFLHELYALELTVINFSSKQMEKTASLAKKYKISVYDASYAVLATEKHCDLITADEKFFHKVKLPFVKLLNKL